MLKCIFWIASDKKGFLFCQTSARKLITRVRVHCVLQTSRYPVDIPSLSSQSQRAKKKPLFTGLAQNILSLSSQSECIKITVYWFGIYYLTQDILTLSSQSECIKKHYSLVWYILTQDILSLSSQSECIKITVYWFGIYYLTQDILTLSSQSECTKNLTHFLLV